MGRAGVSSPTTQAGFVKASGFVSSPEVTVLAGLWWVRRFSACWCAP